MEIQPKSAIKVGAFIPETYSDDMKKKILAILESEFD